MIWNGRFPSSVGVGGVPKISSAEVVAAATLLLLDADDNDDDAVAAGDEYRVRRDGGVDDDCSRCEIVVTNVDGDDLDLDETTDEDIDLFWFRTMNAETWFVLRSAMAENIMKVTTNFVVDGVMIKRLDSSLFEYNYFYSF